MMSIGANPFILFMPSHLVTVAISVFLFIYIPLRINKNAKADWVGYFCKILGILLIGNELGWVIYKFNMVGGGWAEYMPLELCTINAYLLGLLLIFRPAYAVFEVVYFFSMAGTVQGIITPRLFAAFPHYLFWEYFITHTGIVLGALVLIFRYNWKVTWLSLWRAFLWLQVIAFFNLVFDFTFEVNYMFMRNLPRVPSVIDYFGQWPWYIFACEAFGLASFIFYLLPFLLINYRNTSKEIPK
tara:strand:+ start:1234 stop:1959 length:726 start_codon:yes stop_codon:yes gene_type:complete